LNRGIAGDASVVDNNVDLKFGVTLGEEDLAGRVDEQCRASRESNICLNVETGDCVLGFDLLGQGEGLRRRAV
jgi:hypothetical protein